MRKAYTVSEQSGKITSGFFFVLRKIRVHQKHTHTQKKNK